MDIYELTHVFFRCEDDLIYSPKKLGLFYSYESAKRAVQYFITKPGFFENQDAFSARQRPVSGHIIDDTVFEAIIYIHSDDYTFEVEIELGIFGDEGTAQKKLTKYCAENSSLVNTQDFVLETILNKCFIEKLEWPEGFSVYYT